MKYAASAMASVALVLSGCFGPGEPIELPEDWQEAAKMCVAAQSLVLRADRERDEDAPITLEEFSKTVQYPMVAATKGDDVDIRSVMSNLSNLENPMQELAQKDFRSALIECEMRFGFSGKDRRPELPDSEPDAVFSCLAMSSFLQGAMESQAADFGEAAETYSALNLRLREKLNSDVDLQATITKTDPEQLAMDGVSQAFAEGAPQQYMEACEARFPAE